MCTYVNLYYKLVLGSVIALYCGHTKNKNKMARQKKITQTISIVCNYPTFAHIIKNHGIISNCEIEALDNDLLYILCNFHNDSDSFVSLAETLERLDIDFTKYE